MIQIEQECARSSQSEYLAQRQPSQSQQSSSFSSNNHQQFQKRFKIHQLQSQVNEVSIQLHKTALKFQHQLKHQKSSLEQLKSQNKHLLTIYHNLHQEYQKVTLLFEAERQSRKTYTMKYKQVSQKMVGLSKIVGTHGEGIQTTFSQVEKIVRKQMESRKVIQQLDQRLEKAKKEYDYELKIILKNRQNKQKQLKQQFSTKITHLQRQNRQIKQLNQQIQAQLNQKRQKLITFQKYQKQNYQNYSNLQLYKKSSQQKAQQLQKLKLKLQMFNITKIALKQQRYKFDQQIQQLKFKLQLWQKKIQLGQSRLKQMQATKARLQDTVSLFKQKQRQLSQKHIQVVQQNSQLQKKMHIWQLYKDKYKQNKLQSKEICQRADYYQSLAQEYANGMHQLQQQLQNVTSHLQVMNRNQGQLREELEKRDKEVLKFNLINNHQAQLIKDKNQEIKGLKCELDQKNRHLNNLLNNNVQMKLRHDDKQPLNQHHTPNQNPQPLNLHPSPQQLTKTKQLSQLINHYKQILSNQNKLRSNIQQQLNEKHSQCLKLKLDINQLQITNSGLRQQNKLIKQEKNRLMIIRQQKQVQFSLKLNHIKSHYQQTKQISKQSSTNKYRKLKIISQVLGYIFDPTYHNYSYHRCQPQYSPLNQHSNPYKKYSNSSNTKLLRYKSSQEIIQIPNSPSNQSRQLQTSPSYTSYRDRDRDDRIRFQQKQHGNMYERAQQSRKIEIPVRIQGRSIEKANRFIQNSKMLDDEIRNIKNSKSSLKNNGQQV